MSMTIYTLRCTTKYLFLFILALGAILVPPTLGQDVFNTGGNYKGAVLGSYEWYNAHSPGVRQRAAHCLAILPEAQALHDKAMQLKAAGNQRAANEAIAQRTTRLLAFRDCVNASGGVTYKVKAEKAVILGEISQDDLNRRFRNQNRISWDSYFKQVFAAIQKSWEWETRDTKVDRTTYQFVSVDYVIEFTDEGYRPVNIKIGYDPIGLGPHVIAALKNAQIRDIHFPRASQVESVQFKDQQFSIGRSGLKRTPGQYVEVDGRLFLVRR